MKATFELYDRGLQRTLGRFRHEASALSFVERCVQRSRILHLTLGAEFADGQYKIVSDGPDLLRKLDQVRRGARSRARDDERCWPAGRVS